MKSTRNSKFFMTGLLLFALSSVFWSGDFLWTLDSFVILNIRVPRVLMGFFSGATLACTGLFFQALFRNPLASPFTLGSASSASFGATISLFFFSGHSFFGFLSLTSLFAFLFSFLSIFFIYAIWKMSGKKKVTDLLLSGVILTYVFSSGILLIQSFSDSNTVSQITVWMMGGIDILGLEKPIFLGLILLITLPFLYRLLLVMDLISHSEKLSLSKGLQLDSIYKKVLFICSFLSAVTVSMTGPIGLVGLLSPHFSKKLFGARMSANFVPNLLIGGCFVAISDGMLRFLFPERLIPVGVMTSFLGGIFFLYLLLKKET